MKHFILALLLFVSWVSVSAQQAQLVNIEPQRYVITKFENTNDSKILYIDTATGNIKCIEWNTETSKTKITDFDGCPNIEASQSYNGRFSLTCANYAGWQTFFLTDHKNGDVWQLHKGVSQHTLVKVISTSE